MKTIIILLLAVAALSSCKKEVAAPEVKLRKVPTEIKHDPINTGDNTDTKEMH